MRYANKRAEGIALLRQHVREEVAAGQRAAFLLHELHTAIRAIQQEAMVEFDIPGVRYWYLPESEDYWATMPGESLPTERNDTVAALVIELTRSEFIGRQNLHFGYDESRI